MKVNDPRDTLSEHWRPGVETRMLVSARNGAAQLCMFEQWVAPGNGAPIGGLKVVTASGWFAARPSGTEDVYKLYAESFRGRSAGGRSLRGRRLFSGDW